MSYHSTPENRHFGASFTSVGGVEFEAEISMSQNTEKDRKKSALGTSMSIYGVGEINV